MKLLLTVLCLLVPVAQAEVYRSTNAAGEVIYTDVPTEGSERVVLPPLSTVPPPQQVRSRIAATSARGTEQEQAYRRFHVATPENDASVWSSNGDIKLGVLLEPALRTDIQHRIQYYLDGQPYGPAEQSLVHNYRGIERGTHTLGAAVVDSQGVTVISADAVTVHLHKASALHPNNPLNAPATGGSGQTRPNRR